MISVAINGVCGRMGRIMLRLAFDDPEVMVAVGLEHAGHPDIGKDLGRIAGGDAYGIAVSDKIEQTVDVLIDFSSPEGTMNHLNTCAEQNIAMVTGTTGFTEEQMERIRETAGRIGIVQAPNMAVGVNVLFSLIRSAAGLLDEEYDAEIIETHHRFKADAPSGTAKQLVRMIVEGRNIETPKVVYGREGRPGQRPPGEIGVHAVRAGDIVGEHRVIFSTLGESLEITHRAHNREGFARGAIRAAKFVAGKEPGLYSMSDVLGL